VKAVNPLLRYLLQGPIALLIISTCIITGAQAEEVQLNMTQAKSGNLYVHATLQSAYANTDTDLLLDTGASYVALTRATFERLNGEAESSFSRYIFGAMANGKVEKIPLYLLAELKLAENCVLNNIEVAVFPKADKDILGLNALSRMQPFTMQFAPALLTSNHCASS